jgi:hypothetical protein
MITPGAGSNAPNMGAIVFQPGAGGVQPVPGITPGAGGYSPIGPCIGTAASFWPRLVLRRKPRLPSLGGRHPRVRCALLAWQR